VCERRQGANGGRESESRGHRGPEGIGGEVILSESIPRKMSARRFHFSPGIGVICSPNLSLQTVPLDLQRDGGIGKQEMCQKRAGRREETLTEVGVLLFLGSFTGRMSVISFHLFPSCAWERRMMKSSSIVKGE
jgi:hypothetical protein